MASALLGSSLCFVMLIANMKGKYFYDYSFFYLLLFASVPMVIDLYKKYSLLISVLFFFVMYQCLYSVFDVTRIYEDLPVDANRILDIQAGRTSIIVLVGSVFLVKYKSLKRTIDWFCFFNSIYIFYNYLSGNIVAGFSNNIGIDSIIMASWSPMLLRKKSSILVLIPVACAIFLGGTVTGSAALLFGIFLFLFFGQNIRRKIAMTAVGAALVATAFFNLNMFNDGNRFKTWSQFINYIFNGMDIIGGLGAGSFWVFGPKIQSEHISGRFWGYIFAHNEFLQIFMEYGAVVFIIFALCVIMLPWKDMSKHLKCSVLVYIFTFMTWVPLRFFPGLFFGLVLLGECYALRSNNQRTLLEAYRR